MTVQPTVHIEAEEVPEDEDKPTGQILHGNTIALNHEVPENAEGVVVGAVTNSHSFIGSPEARHATRHGPHHYRGQGDAQPNLEKKKVTLPRKGGEIFILIPKF